MPQAVTIRSLPWGESYRPFGRQAIADLLRGQMDQAIDDHLDRMAVLDQADRRNGPYARKRRQLPVILSADEGTRFLGRADDAPGRARRSRPLTGARIETFPRRSCRPYDSVKPHARAWR